MSSFAFAENILYQVRIFYYIILCLHSKAHSHSLYFRQWSLISCIDERNKFILFFCALNVRTTTFVRDLIFANTRDSLANFFSMHHTHSFFFHSLFTHSFLLTVTLNLCWWCRVVVRMNCFLSYSSTLHTNNAAFEWITFWEMMVESKKKKNCVNCVCCEFKTKRNNNFSFQLFSHCVRFYR